MNSVNTAFIRLAFFFIAGILAGFFSEVQLSLLFILAGVGMVLFLLAYIRSKALFLQDVYFGTSAFLLFFLLGIGTTQLHLPKNQPSHYINHLSSESEKESIILSVEEELKPDLFNNKYIGNVHRLGDQSVHGKILLLIPKDSAAIPIYVDDILMVYSEVEAVPGPLNPHQFNYKRFMWNRGVTGQMRLYPNNFKPLLSKSSSLTGLAANWRGKIVSNLKRNKIDREELAIIQALLLGQRQDISEEIYNNYTAAGVIHILAVSGLHVGIVLWILFQLLSPLEKLKHGRVMKLLITVLLLWLFAVLAGLSPSVVRAVTMFTFVAIGLQIKRRTNVLNSLFMSMVLLLLIRPQFIFEVGFQLSYMAVFSIVLFQPLLYNLFHPKNVVVKYLWGIFTVTLAAQAGVLPLSLLYFHQFPGLFFLSNLVILPFLGLVLALGILVIVLALVNLLPAFLSEIYSFLINALNRFVAWVAGQESFLFQDIPFSGYQTVAFYLFLLCLFLLLNSWGYKMIMVVLSAVIVLQLVFYYEKMGNNTEELIVFHKSRNTIIGKKQNQNLLLAHNLAEAPAQLSAVRNYVVGERMKNLHFQKLENVYGIKEDVLLIIDSTEIYQIPDLKPAYVLLSNSPKLNLNRLLEDMEPIAIIADGSNYKTYVDRWKETCRRNNVPFHYTGTEGAFILR